MPQWQAGQMISLQSYDRLKLAKALWENACHNQNTVSATDHVIWDEEVVKEHIKEHGYTFNRIGGKDLNCDLDGDNWDPMGYINIHGSEACQNAIWKARGLKPPVDQAPEEKLGAWDRTAKHVSENRRR